MPDRLYVVDAEGKIAFRGEQGPMGFKPEQMEPRLREVLGLPKEGGILEGMMSRPGPRGSRPR
jgi:hypothetical protein